MPGMPGHVIDERDNLLAFIDQQAYTLGLSARGLTDDQARSRPTPSALSIGGTLRHVTTVVRGCARQVAGEPVPDSDRSSEFTMGPDERISQITADLQASVAELRVAVADQPLDRQLAIAAAPWMPDVPTLALRNRLAHMIDEIARHNGHTDILRETIDGVDAGSLMAGAEGWAPNPWITPYVPPNG